MIITVGIKDHYPTEKELRIMCILMIIKMLLLAKTVVETW